MRRPKVLPLVIWAIVLAVIVITLGAMIPHSVGPLFLAAAVINAVVINLFPQIFWHDREAE